MSKKVNNLERVFRELFDRYGSEDEHVLALQTELDVMESVEFRAPSRPLPRSFQSRTTGDHRRNVNLAVPIQSNVLH